MNITKETFLTAAGIITLCVNLVTEIIKKAAPKFPAEATAYISAVILTLASFAAYTDIAGVSAEWYMWTAAGFCGLFIGNTAQTGYDKLTEIAEKLFGLIGKD